MVCLEQNGGHRAHKWYCWSKNGHLWAINTNTEHSMVGVMLRYLIENLLGMKKVVFDFLFERSSQMGLENSAKTDFWPFLAKLSLSGGPEWPLIWPTCPNWLWMHLATSSDHNISIIGIPDLTVGVGLARFQKNGAKMGLYP